MLLLIWSVFGMAGIWAVVAMFMYDAYSDCKAAQEAKNLPPVIREENTKSYSSTALDDEPGYPEDFEA